MMLSVRQGTDLSRKMRNEKSEIWVDDVNWVETEVRRRGSLNHPQTTLEWDM